MDALMPRLDAMAATGGFHYVCFCEAHLCVRAAREPEVANALERASLVLPDGVSMVLGARLAGLRLPRRLTGPAVLLEYCRHGVALGKRHFFYGGAEGVADTLATRLKTMIPSLQVAGTFSPPFREMTAQEEALVKRTIEASRSDVLWVGLGAPKQELWMAAHVGRLRVPLMMGVGAAFDFHSGLRKWAPAWVRKAGMEWLYRMLTGGRRVFVRNARYDAMMLWMLVGQAWRRLASRTGRPCAGR